MLMQAKTANLRAQLNKPMKTCQDEDDCQTPMWCRGKDKCQKQAEPDKAKHTLDAADCSLVKSQLEETLSKLRWLIYACERQAESTGQESIHLRSARIKCKQWVECFQ